MWSDDKTCFLVVGRCHRSTQFEYCLYDSLFYLFFELMKRLFYLFVININGFSIYI